MSDPMDYKNWKPEDFPPNHRKVREIGDPGDFRKHVGLALALCVALFLAWVLAGSPL